MPKRSRPNNVDEGADLLVVGTQANPAKKMKARRKSTPSKRSPIKQSTPVSLVNKNSVHLENLADEEVWEEQSQFGIQLVNDLHKPSDRLLEELCSLKPLLKCVGKRGANTQRAVECLSAGNSTDFVIEYDRRNKSGIGALCFHGSIMRFFSCGAQFVIISRVDQNSSAASYFCTPLHNLEACKRLRSNQSCGFNKSAAKAIKLAIDSLNNQHCHSNNANSTKKICYPQTNEVCLNSHPSFVKLILNRNPNSDWISKRVAAEEGRLPNEVISALIALVNEQPASQPSASDAPSGFGPQSKHLMASAPLICDEPRILHVEPDPRLVEKRFEEDFRAQNSCADVHSFGSNDCIVGEESQQATLVHNSVTTDVNDHLLDPDVEILWLEDEANESSLIDWLDSLND